MTDLCDDLRALAASLSADEWELPIDAVFTCNASAICIELAKKDVAELQGKLAATEQRCLEPTIFQQKILDDLDEARQAARWLLPLAGKLNAEAAVKRHPWLDAPQPTENPGELEPVNEGNE